MHYRYITRAGELVGIRINNDGSETEFQIANFTARITRSIKFDDGQNTKLHFDIEAEVGSKTMKLQIPADSFGYTRWVHKLGPTAVIHAGQEQHARVAIQLLSGKNIPEKCLFTHTGWREIEGNLVYLHAGGAIGASGPVPEVGVKLSDALAPYDLRLPQDEAHLRDAVRMSLRMLDLAADPITVPLLAAPFRAVLKPADFVVFLNGQSGGLKTAAAALAQQHFGALLDNKHAPADWIWTPNALQLLAFHAKDALLLIDDFAPNKAAPQKARRYQDCADQVIRAVGNCQDRGRMASGAGSLRPERRPRGLVLATGEQVPLGESIQGRMLVVPVAKGDIDLAVLSELQRAGEMGYFAVAMGGFVQWIAGRYHSMQVQHRQRTLELRNQRLGLGGHARTPSNIADLLAGFEIVMQFMADVGAITPTDLESFMNRAAAALHSLGAAQSKQGEAGGAERLFLRMLASALESGEGHVATREGGEPEKSARWGWHIDAETGACLAHGKRIGWLDGDDFYLEPRESLSVAESTAREPMGVTDQVLRKRLKTAGLLASVDEARGTLTVRRMIEGEQRSVLHLSARQFTDITQPEGDSR